ncbi:hypothetical protein [Flavobacterium kingsejongi]|uniref:Uncharacterized protein n=1 Tax=Flavobacterium kingsejongi TaxID=1678728 RepID=A0A2S1LMU7_9FLAO|nr:hypothetical protein [Flavobacterium kingsejongi]AWG24815.1 hypothetical protein FK004_06020 [Flavobacterium kingsejongi]AWG25039.1 hypothetical protein FK004_07235 [Flavobacterium kingsejongi]
MVLNFLSQINDKPTYFAEKLTKGLLQNKDIQLREQMIDRVRVLFDADVYACCAPKIHEIIDFNLYFEPHEYIVPTIAVIRKKMGELKCYEMVHISRPFKINGYQNVIIEADKTNLQISVNGRKSYDKAASLKFAVNEGFDTWADFSDYWRPKAEKCRDNIYFGRMIHFTDFRY